MSPIVIVIVVLAPLAVAGIGLLALRSRRRLPRKLDENWWPDFEQAFRDYAAGTNGRSLSKRANQQPHT